MPLVELNIEGMSCGHCSARVEKVLSEIEGVANVSVDLDGGKASLETGAHVAMADLVASVEQAGYDASVV
jgi:copper chaperone CopZ